MSDIVFSNNFRNYLKFKLNNRLFNIDLINDLYPENSQDFLCIQFAYLTVIYTVVGDMVYNKIYHDYETVPFSEKQLKSIIHESFRYYCMLYFKYKSTLPACANTLDCSMTINQIEAFIYEEEMKAVNREYNK